MERVVVLLSGGLDSAANLAFACDQDKPVLALTIDYGQKAALQEINASKNLAEYYEVPHQVVSLTWLGQLGGNSLTDSKLSLPEIQSSELDDVQITQKTANAVWVPNRNGVFINIAGSFAERLDAKKVVVGFNREEAVTFPDNSSDFLNAVSGSFKYSTKNQVSVSSYTDRLNKIEIVAKLRKLNQSFPFEKVWSCYMGGEVICKKCESCRRFLRAVES